MVYLVKPNTKPSDISMIDGVTDADVVEKLNTQSRLNKLPYWQMATANNQGVIAQSSAEKLYRAR